MTPLTDRISRAELLQRLEEAEEIIRAIREGEVDALVVQKGRANVEEVFTLGGDDSYRSFMEAMDIGAAAFDLRGNLLYHNAALSQLLHIPEGVAGEAVLELLDGNSRATLSDLLVDAREKRSSRDIRIPRDGSHRILLLKADKLLLGVSDAIAVTFDDITDRIHDERAHEAERMAMAVLSSAAEAVIVTDMQGFVSHANAAALALCRRDPVGAKFSTVFELEFKATTGLMQSDDFISLALSGHSVQGIEAFALNERNSQPLLVSAAPLRVAENETKGAVVTLIDLSRHKEAERQQLLLMRELDHRVKNTLALVVSISNRTASTEDTVDGFRRAFAGRIQALAATHNVLAERSWISIRLSDLIAAELKPFVENFRTRFAIKGGDLDILPRAAVPLGLIIHELTTNAAKYGALSNDAGMVTVELEPDQGTGSRVINWIESGGPKVAEPTRKGFGSTVIGRSLNYSVHGGAETMFNESGLTCRIRVPSEDVVAPD